nr:transposase [Paenibacillus roseus]
MTYFFRSKWPNGYCCSRCGHRQAYTIRTRKAPLFQCANCRYQSSLTTGTIMEHTRTSLENWYAALQLMSRPGGIHAVQLQQRLKVSYKTAWSMLKRVRMAISMMDMERPLFGSVQAQLGFYGDAGRQSLRKDPREHSIIAMSASLQSLSKKNDLLMKAVPCENLSLKSLKSPLKPALFNTYKESLINPVNYLKLKIANPAFMNNRGMPAVLQPLFFRNHIAKRDLAVNSCPLSLEVDNRSLYLRRVISDARYWINHTFHGIGAKYLQLYWDEFCFRLNCGNRPLSAHHALGTLCMQAVR